jgi:hypothetical protein
MGGGLMQLVAYGAQDIYLTGNPQITFFKVVYRRHTNFSMEAIEQTWIGNADGVDGRCTSTISRNGDLVHRMYLEFTLTSTGVVGKNNPTAAAIKNIELEIGGQKIDKHSGQWMETWVELTEPNPPGITNGTSGASEIGTLFQKMSSMGGKTCNGVGLPTGIYFVPLQFWFCRNPGLALPLIALQYHEVKIILDHEVLTSLGSGATNKLWADYIYLDTDERRRFAQVSHEYLIEQVQEQNVTQGSSSNVDIEFNHPVKFLALSGTIDTAGSMALSPPVSSGTVQLKLNGHDRFAERDYRYFSRTQVWENFSGTGGLDSVSVASQGRLNDSILVYSFALKPEEHQPSGTCNFSRIDNAQLVTSAPRANVPQVLYAVNYNVLRIMSGMGGLAYSN